MVDIKLQDADQSRHHSRTAGDGQKKSGETQHAPGGRGSHEALGLAAPLTQALFDAFQRSATTHPRRGEALASPRTLATTLTLPKPRCG